MPERELAATIGETKGGTMKVRELMTKDVVSVRPDTPLREAAALLVARKI